MLQGLLASGVQTLLDRAVEIFGAVVEHLPEFVAEFGFLIHDALPIS
jgi:hypothetical protein